MLILGIYASYDKIAKTTGTPFLASNDESALEMFYEMRKKIKEKNKNLEENRLTVLNLGYYSCNIIENKNSQGEILSFEPNIFLNNQIYDVLDKPIEVKKRKEIIYNEEMLKLILGEVNGD